MRRTVPDLLLVPVGIGCMPGTIRHDHPKHFDSDNAYGLHFVAYSFHKDDNIISLCEGKKEWQQY